MRLLKLWGEMMKNDLPAFGQKLKEIRKNLGLTQDDALNKCSAFLIPKAKEIYQFMYQNCPESYPVYTQICFHLGFLLINQQQYCHAKIILEKGVRASQAHLSYSLLPQLYYAKAVCEYYLSPALCSHTFLYSYVLAKAFDNEEFAEWISDVCSNFYQLKLELE